MSIILSLIALPLSILIFLKYFNLYDAGNIFDISIALIGAIFLVAMQIMSYITIHSANKGTTLMGKIIKTILALPGILYLINLAYPISMPIDLELFVAFFLFTEGIYGLH